MGWGWIARCKTVRSSGGADRPKRAIANKGREGVKMVENGRTDFLNGPLAIDGLICCCLRLSPCPLNEKGRGGSRGQH